MQHSFVLFPATTVAVINKIKGGYKKNDRVALALFCYTNYYGNTVHYHSESKSGSNKLINFTFA